MIRAHILAFCRDKRIVWGILFYKHTFLLPFISASNGNLRPTRTAKQFSEPRFGVLTHYYRLTMWPVMCDQKCDGPTNAWVVRCLSWKTISVPWFGRDCWHDGRADNSNKTANNAKYSNCKGLNHETHDVSLQNLRSRPFWILSPLRILFLSVLCLFTS